MAASGSVRCWVSSDAAYSRLGKVMMVMMMVMISMARLLLVYKLGFGSVLLVNTLDMVGAFSHSARWWWWW